MILELFLCLFFTLVVFYCAYYVFCYLYGQHTIYGSRDDFLSTVSIVTATYNERATIEKKIANIIDLDYPKNMLEIIFVDSSTDGTRDFIRNFKSQSGIKVILIEEDERRGLPLALNSAYQTASGEIVIKSDCDILLESDAIRRIVNYFDDPSTGAVNGAVRVLNQCDLETGYFNIIDKLRLAEANLDSTYVFSSFSAYRRSLIERLNVHSLADEAELAIGIRRKGYKTRYAPDAISYETIPLSFKMRVKQKSRRSQGQILLILQNLDILFNPRYGNFGLIVFPTNFFMMIISPWLLLLTIILGGFLFYELLWRLFFPLILIAVFMVIVVWKKLFPNVVAAFIDAQLNLLIGFWKLLFRPRQILWEKVSVET